MRNFIISGHRDLVFMARGRWPMCLLWICLQDDEVLESGVFYELAAFLLLAVMALTKTALSWKENPVMRPLLAPGWSPSSEGGWPSAISCHFPPLSMSINWTKFLAVPRKCHAVSYCLILSLASFASKRPLWHLASIPMLHLGECYSIFRAHLAFWSPPQLTFCP